MGDIVSTVLSTISGEPIVVLAIIFFVLSNILKSNKSTEEEQQKDTSEAASTGGMTWEDMERAYGIKIDKKDEPATIDKIDAVGTIDNAESGDVHNTLDETATIDNSEPVDAYHTSEVIEPKKKKTQKSTESTLEERLAAYNRESAAALQTLELAQSEENHVTKVEKKQHRQRQPISVKEGMRWSIILDKPKALQMKSR